MALRIACWFGIAIAAWSVALCSSAALGQQVEAGRDTLDAAPFAVAVERGDAKSYGVRWAEPRKIRRLVVEFSADATPPPPEKLKVQYWHRNWDGRPDPVAAETAAGGEGWAAMDDWTNGGWKTAQTQVRADGRTCSFTFAPTDAREFEDLKQPGVAYRKTLKMRVVADGELPRPARLLAFTDAACRPLTVRVLWGRPAEPAIRTDTDDPGRMEVFNGSLTAVRPIRGGRLVADDRMNWTLPAGTQVRYAGFAPSGTGRYYQGPYYNGAALKVRKFARSGEWLDVNCGSVGAPGNNVSGVAWMNASGESCVNMP